MTSAARTGGGSESSLRVALFNPPFKPEHGQFSRSQRSPAITKSGTLYYPIWLCYAAGALEQGGHEVEVLDAPARKISLAQSLEALSRFSPALVVIDTSTPSIQSDLASAAAVKEATGAFVVLVGTHPTALPAETLALSESVDAVVRGEYEETLLELAGALGSGGAPGPETLSRIHGLTFRRGDEVRSNPDRALIKDLDSLPFVSEVYARHLEIRDYLYTIAQYPQVAILTGRGCPYSCGYCVYPQVMHGKGYRKRSIRSVISEFQFVERRLPEVKEIFIEDDTFTVDRRRVEEFARAYREAGLSISWVANSRADIGRRTLKALKSANCRLLCVGFESGDQGVLDAMGKRLDLERARAFARYARSVGILVHGCFMVGNPGETRETMQKTLELALELMPDTAQFFPIMVYPGTRTYSWARSSGYLETEDYSRWLTDEGNHQCVVSTPELSPAALVSFCDQARRTFYLRPRYLLYRVGQLCRHPRQDGPRMLKSLSKFWKVLLRGTDRRGS